MVSVCVPYLPLGLKVLIRFRDGPPSCGSAVIGNLLCGKHAVHDRYAIVLQSVFLPRLKLIAIVMRGVAIIVIQHGQQLVP